jgi:hypothetical protein
MEIAEEEAVQRCMRGGSKSSIDSRSAAG